MDRSEPTRREFVSASAGLLGGGWLWLQLPALASLSACARDAARSEQPFTTFTAAEGRAMRAFAARIIPSADGVPGAEEAGAAWFADLAVAGPFAGMLPPLREGLADIDQRAQSAHGVVFAAATPEQQDAIIRDVEQTPFFGMGRVLVIFGTFSDPSYGGNRDHAGFTMLGLEHAAAYQPPFGYYDAEYARNGGVA
jgi:gluconate 2-dehydrogenase gamma chain